MAGGVKPDAFGALGDRRGHRGAQRGTEDAEMREERRGIEKKGMGV